MNYKETIKYLVSGGSIIRTSGPRHGYTYLTKSNVAISSFVFSKIYRLHRDLLTEYREKDKVIYILTK